MTDNYLEHLGYVNDLIRLESYCSAVKRFVKRGISVIDLGCGSGILGLICLQSGAARVFAIDSTEMIDIARETLTRAGFGSQTVFIHGHSHRIDIPEMVDLVICDNVGYFGFDYGIVHTLQDARRFLKPGGCMIPSRIRLMLGLVESEKCRDRAEGWNAENVPTEFHWLRQYSVNTKHSVELSQEALLGIPVYLAEIDLWANNPDFFCWTEELCIGRNGIIHGLAGWFECELAEGIWMTNSPLSDQAINRPQAFFPINEAVQVKAGDCVKVIIMARPADHLIAWVVEFPATGQRFRHSTWQGMLLTPEEMCRANPARVPQISRQGQARMTVLNYCDGRRTVREIEQAILRDHPDLFPSPGEISRFVMHVLGRDTA